VTVVGDVFIQYQGVADRQTHVLTDTFAIAKTGLLHSIGMSNESGKKFAVLTVSG